MGIGAVLSLLAAEPCWQHYYVAVVPLAMVLLRPAEPDGARPWLRVLAVLALAMVSLRNVGRLLDLDDPTAAAAILSGGTLLLFAAGIVDLFRPREA